MGSVEFVVWYCCLCYVVVFSVLFLYFVCFIIHVLRWLLFVECGFICSVVWIGDPKFCVGIGLVSDGC